MKNIHDHVEELRETSAEAKKLLESPVLKATFEKLTVEFSSEWQNSKPDQQAVREEAYLKLHILNKIKRAIESSAREASAFEHNNRHKLKDY